MYGMFTYIYSLNYPNVYRYLNTPEYWVSGTIELGAYHLSLNLKHVWCLVRWLYSGNQPPKSKDSRGRWSSASSKWSGLIPHTEVTNKPRKGHLWVQTRSRLEEPGAWHDYLNLKIIKYYQHRGFSTATSMLIYPECFFSKWSLVT